MATGELSNKKHGERVETKDGTHTLFNAEYDQTYHSTSGAYEEAMEKYVRPANIRAGSAVLDYCFGLGYNTLAAMEFAGRDVGGGLHAGLSIVALENDVDMLFKLGTIQFSDEKRQHLYNLLIQPILAALCSDKKDFHYAVGNNRVRIIVGDAREKLLLLLRTSDKRFDVVLFDPFSPKACPHLWTPEVFAQCYMALKSVAPNGTGGGVLTTYSCASSVRKAMTGAGFVVSDGPSIGRRSPSTIAKKL